MNEHLREAYRLGHINSGIKVGDMVKVLRLPRAYEQGWSGGEEYVPQSKRDQVGKIWKVVENHPGEYFTVESREGCGSGNFFPWFVLEKVEDAKSDILDGLDFGFQTEHVRKLIERLDARYGYKEAPDARR